MDTWYDYLCAAYVHKSRKYLYWGSADILQFTVFDEGRDEAYWAGFPYDSAEEVHAMLQAAFEIDYPAEKCVKRTLFHWTDAEHKHRTLGNYDAATQTFRVNGAAGEILVGYERGTHILHFVKKCVEADTVDQCEACSSVLRRKGFPV